MCYCIVLIIVIVGVPVIVIVLVVVVVELLLHHGHSTVHCLILCIAHNLCSSSCSKNVAKLGASGKSPKYTCCEQGPG